MRLMKKFVALSCACILTINLFACGEKMSEEAESIQRKIDKALESEPTYEDLVEIQNGYNDLLMEEQETIQNYDQIQEKLKLTDLDIAAIYTANQLKGMLKNPSSLELLSAGVAIDDKDPKYYVKLVYTAANNVGGNIEDTFYWIVTKPSYDEAQERWGCRTEPDFLDAYETEALLNSLIGTDDHYFQDSAGSSYDHFIEESGELSPQKIMDNIDTPIYEVNYSVGA